MNKDIEDYFQGQFERYTDRNSGFNPRYEKFSQASTVVDAIEKAIANFGDSISYHLPIRPDAKLFLLKNFDDFVFQPLSQSSKGNLNRVALLNSIHADIVNILQSANQLATLNRKNEISSHQVLLAVAANWNNLRTLRKDSW